MGLRIKTNVESLVAQRQLGNNRNDMNESLERLASGLRINKSSDDAAGLAVSESMRAKVRGLAQAKRNASDGVSFLQVAEGGLSEVNNILVRMRELTTQGASDTIGARERGFLNKEFQQLGMELNRITESTEFNGTKLFAKGQDTSGVDYNIRVGVGVAEDGKAGTDEDPNTVRIKLDQVGDLTEALASLPKSITGEKGSELGEEGNTDEIFNNLDGAMGKVTEFRATLGSLQSRMQSTMTSIDVSSENLSAAQSRIRDVDYASETAKLTQSKILSSAGTAVLSQANAAPEQVLQLLRG